MFYEPDKRDRNVLKHNPWTALITPRPIGWISTKSSAGQVNIAPYSYFNAVSAVPPVVMFSSEGRKDTLTFVEETREFVWNMANYDLRNAMNETSANLPRGVSEFEHVGIETAPCELVSPPRVKRCPVAFECRVTEIVPVKTLEGTASDYTMVLGQVVGIHIDERYIRNGMVDTAAMKPLSRLGYQDYSFVEKTFAMARPKG